MRGGCAASDAFRISTPPLHDRGTVSVLVVRLLDLRDDLRSADRLGSLGKVRRSVVSEMEVRTFDENGFDDA
jgi:hypothetical protein